MEEREPIKNVQVKIPIKTYAKLKMKLLEDNTSLQDFLLTACKRYLKKDTKLTPKDVKVKKKKKKRE